MAPPDYWMLPSRNRYFRLRITQLRRVRICAVVGSSTATPQLSRSISSSYRSALPIPPNDVPMIALKCKMLSTYVSMVDTFLKEGIDVDILFFLNIIPGKPESTGQQQFSTKWRWSRGYKPRSASSVDSG